MRDRRRRAAERGERVHDAREREPVARRDPRLASQASRVDRRVARERVRARQGDVERLDEQRRRDDARARPLRVVREPVGDHDVVVGREAREAIACDVRVVQREHRVVADRREQRAEEREPCAVERADAHDAVASSVDAVDDVASARERLVDAHPGVGDGVRPPTAGDLLVMAAAVVRAVHVTASGHLTRGRADGSLGVVVVQLAVGAVVFVGIAGPTLPRAAATLDARGIAAVLFLGLLCSVFAFVVQLWAVRRTSAARASILMGTEPVWAVAIGVALAGDRLGPIGAAGAALVIGATSAGQWIERRHRERAAPREEHGRLEDAARPHA